MIEIAHGNILDADVEALVNPVNCVGVMGRGLALQFRNAFPDNYKAYKLFCDHHGLQTGSLMIYQQWTMRGLLLIINFPTKRHWKDKSHIEDIKLGLTTLVSEVHTRKVHSIAIPALGCGLGELNWHVVRPIIEKAFEGTTVNVKLYSPHSELL